MDMDWDFIGFFLAAWAVVFFLVAGLILGANALSANSCEAAVFNDNGDMTVSSSRPTYDDFCNAYFATKATG